MNYSKLSKEQKKLYHKEATKRWWDKLPPNVKMYLGCRQRAVSKGIDINIEPIDIFVPEKCPILDIKLKNNPKVIKDDSYTLDRKNNKKGYVKGNVWVISNLANKMKNNATKEQLIKFAKWVLAEYS